ncbi:carboxy terminal-processing peptidase [Xenorhabdus bovienii]|uniref:Carboxy-terminal protease for penicillin-binding protein 3 n=1 Tax=Xenorhabdus bovienii str. feltiae Moldova TaxID=1398200 RepID=A0A077P1S8_XENBV|nr:carboxy terminal-processing peptidase [Xenorhabdus bovienii]CDG87878.1 carboxy-terminal protease for penicillin-binding protein 3 [Xenorhabdus bovienii str. feltiae France]CDG94523.1 carboxy-terminal protease for penicillin-binding protein 3 [Xenorhabdus bovienii str. feltiae Florida]CDH03776.1 carboxy-terminal protease for penicillin-binding protein 3 [Xenorhabdus bovienii str. feltiae Moldova]
MNKLINLAFVLGLSFSGIGYANTANVIGSSTINGNNAPVIALSQLPDLKPEQQHSTVSKRIVSRFLRSHYRHFYLDVAFSGKVFDRYLNALDYGHNVFLASDIAQFAEQKGLLGKALENGDLRLPYALFNLMQKRRFERYQYVLSRLEQPVNLDGNDTFETERTKAPWSTSVEELNKLWDAKIKSDWINLKLSGKDDKEIKEILTKRYRTHLKRLNQSKSEDVFQIIMMAFAREIDPHTSYLSPSNTEQFNSEMSLSLEGIGAVLQYDDEYIAIRSLVGGGPAAKSNLLKDGDKIIGVGQAGKPIVDVVGWRLEDVVTLIKGPKGSKVLLEIIPSTKGAKNHIVTLTRENIRLEDNAVKMSVKTVGKEKIGVLDIPSFYVGLTNDVKIQLQKLTKQGVSSIVIDLRSNGGGALTEAVSLSGLFISTGPIVQIRDNTGRIKQDSDTDEAIYYKGPLVVLVDGRSASASEIFAAVMQDYGRGLIVGDPTFGKGTVQNHRSLNRIYDQMLKPDWPEIGSVQYTVQKFYRVNGGSTQLKGVTPDILMPTAEEPADIGESQEDNALPWDSIQPASYPFSKVISASVPLLTQLHNQRIANAPEFKYIKQDIAYYKLIKARNGVYSLNYAQREKENKEYESIKLNRINERFKREGKKPLKSLDDLPKDYKGPDPYLDESVQIALDLAHQPAEITLTK